MSSSPLNKTSPFFIAILGALMAFTSLSTDVYLPALPKMSRDLAGDAELSVTAFLAGFALSQLIWGVVSDRIGRKRPLLIGMVLFAVGSAGCALADNIAQMVCWRVVQAAGACTAPMAARAMVRDLFDKTQAVQMLSTLTMVMAAAPIVGPLLGGQIIKTADWHAVFWLLALFGVLMALSVIRLPETLPKDKRQAGRAWRSVFADYLTLLKNRPFMRYTLCLAFFYTGAYAFVVGSPKVYLEFFGISEQAYGFWFAVNIIGVMLLSFANKRLVRRFSPDTLLKYASLTASVAGLGLMITAFMQTGGIWAVAVLVWLFFSMNGIIASCANASALDLVPHTAGAGSALIGALQYGSGIVSSLLLVAFDDGTAWTMAWIIGVFAFLCVLTVYKKPS